MRYSRRAKNGWQVLQGLSQAKEIPGVGAVVSEILCYVAGEIDVIGVQYMCSVGY